MNRLRPHFVSFGPPIPVVPIGDFSKTRLSDDDLASLWWLCGPSAAQNMRGLEMWKVIAMAYYEGLNHGSGIVAERQTTPQPELRPFDC